MSLPARFGRFWWSFVVGDDWRVAAGVAATLGLAWLLVESGADPWWIVPPAVAAVLAASLWRETRAERRRASDP